MPALSIRVEGAEELARELAGAGQKLDRPLRPLLEAVAAVWQGFFQENLRAEGQRLGPSWPALAPRTQRDRQAQGYGAAHPMLIRTTDLLHSIGTLAASERWIEVGSRQPKASLLQRGGKTGQGTIVPPRPFVGLTRQDVDDTFEMVAAYFLGEGGDA